MCPLTPLTTGRSRPRAAVRRVLPRVPRPHTPAPQGAVVAAATGRDGTVTCRWPHAGAAAKGHGPWCLWDLLGPGMPTTD
ncbi:hypothetical protein AV530_014172 [Patagioenas fasciata monilis]|uniref:Uncharacterized protein n=1 Tax=Patagioenas fasciata monilis TaxID=372326 RepID=A0A1V4K678_PATFA|nr:hypothetical protein AV530_014172 [Patagioenas fasciata monilis]